MGVLDSITNALQFSSSVQNTTAKKADKADKKQKVRKSKFNSLLKNSISSLSFTQDGLPAELASMEVEEAVVYLKDKIDAAGDALKEERTLDTYKEFRESVSSFLKYMERVNYEVTSEEKKGKAGRLRVYRGISPYFSEVRKPDPYVQVKVINERMQEIASMVLQNQMNNISLLSKVDEIKGLIVNILAA